MYFVHRTLVGKNLRILTMIKSKSAAERRAFLKTLKPRLIEIAEATAARIPGGIDENDLHARIDAGVRERAESKKPVRETVPH